MIPYEELIEQRETPFYVFDRRGFIDNYHALQSAMRAVYPKYLISYSYKTNYTPYVCELVKKLGGYAEVVSDMEYMLARKIGYENSMIVYNGPAKGDCLDEHLLNGGIVNIDSADEAERIASCVSKQKARYVKVGLRINLDLGAGHISRFGLFPGSEDMDRAIAALKRAGVKIVGLHCHISRNREIEAWKKRAMIMLDAASKYVEGIPEYISLGSGMYGDMDYELRKQFGTVPTYEDYAKATMQPFTNHYGDNGPIIFTEPGTTVVARYLNFVSSVMSIKELRGRNIATMDGSYENLGEVCTIKKLPVKVVKSGGGKKYAAIDLMGYTCLEQDMMYANYAGELAAGDVLVFENVGGYSIVSKPQFIRPNCSMIACEDNGSVEEIMRGETFNDVFSKFTFAES